MARALFCVCAPGATQDTTRFFRAILKGCIPVTFFRCPDPCPDLCADLRPILLVNPCNVCPVHAACLYLFCLQRPLCIVCILRALESIRVSVCKDTALPARSLSMSRCRVNGKTCAQ